MAVTLFLNFWVEFSHSADMVILKICIRVIIHCKKNNLTVPLKEVLHIKKNHYSFSSSITESSSQSMYSQNALSIAIAFERLLR